MKRIIISLVTMIILVLMVGCGDDVSEEIRSLEAKPISIMGVSQAGIEFGMDKETIIELLNKSLILSEREDEISYDANESILVIFHFNNNKLSSLAYYIFVDRMPDIDGNTPNIEELFSDVENEIIEQAGAPTKSKDNREHRLYSYWNFKEQCIAVSLNDGQELLLVTQHLYDNYD